MRKHIANGFGFEGALLLSLSQQLKANEIKWTWDPDDREATTYRTGIFQNDIPDDLKTQMGAASDKAASWIVGEYCKPKSTYRLGSGDDARNGDISDVTLRNCNHDIRISAKWQSKELKGPRFHPKLMAEKYGTCDGSDWVVDGVNLQQLLRQWAGRPWQELKDEIGADNLYRLFQTKLCEQLRLIQASPELTKQLANEIFGLHDHLRISATTRKGKAPRVEVADFREKNVIKRISFIEQSTNSKWVFVHFGHDFNVKLRLRNRDEIIKPGGMSFAATIQSWGGYPPCVLT